MAVPISPRRTRPRFGLGAGLAAAARGPAFTGLMLAGLVLLAVVLGAVGLILFGLWAIILDAGRPELNQKLRLALLVIGAGLLAGRFLLPPALLGIRRLASLTRRLAGEWCGVLIAEPRPLPPPHEGRLGYTERLRWLVTDPATWRDLRWTAVNLVAWILALLPLALIGTGLIEFIGPELIKTIPPPAFPGNSAGTLIVLGLAISSAGIAAAPALLRGYGLLAGAVLAPSGHAELEQRVRQLTQTRTEALDTGAAEIRRIERRLAAFDGVLAISSPPGGPTAVTMEIPCALSSPKTSSC